MRIVHVMLSKNFSGAERHVVELASHQAKTQEVHVILHKKAFGDRDNSIAHRFPSSVQIHKVGRPIRQWTFAQVRKVIEGLSPSIVHCHLKAAAKSVRGLKINSACLATLHIDYDSAQHDHMDGLIAITPHQASRVKAKSSVYCQQIDNWVTESPANAEQALSVRLDHGIDEGALLIGSIGRIEETKQHKLLIEAVTPLLSSNIKLAIVGQGRLYEKLRAEHPEVIMPGYSTQAKAWMRSFDIFVSAANYEPFGLVFLEAMQAGTPIVTTATEGAEHLAEAMQITPVPIHDVDKLREAIKAKLAEAPQRMEYDYSSFSLEKKSDEVLQLYLKLLKRKA